MQKTKQGISLIVLVITIIVMIILAATVIITLNNNGIIDKANEAVDKTNEKQVQELANLAWADAYAENVGKSDEELLPLLKASVEKALSDNNINKEDYGIVVTTTGVTVAKGWFQTSDRTVVKGDTVLNIGDDISYDETNGGTVTVETDVDWKVLGAENGELLIMSASDVRSSYTLGSDSDLSVAKDAYENGISELNEICAPYGKGTYATKARSITVEDVDRVTGYDKTTYNKGKIDEYGNIVTYSYNGTNKPAYSGTNGVSGTLTIEHSSGFHWYDLNNVYHNVSASDLINADNNGKEIAKIKSTHYTYFASVKTDLQTAAPNAYNMIYSLSGENRYWLASSSAWVDYYSACFGLRCVSFTEVKSIDLIDTYGRSYGYSFGVRAVVQLSSNVNLTGSSESGWSIV